VSGKGITLTRVYTWACLTRQVFATFEEANAKRISVNTKEAHPNARVTGTSPLKASNKFQGLEELKKVYQKYGMLVVVFSCLGNYSSPC